MSKKVVVQEPAGSLGGDLLIWDTVWTDWQINRWDAWMDRHDGLSYDGRAQRVDRNWLVNPQIPDIVDQIIFFFKFQLKQTNGFRVMAFQSLAQNKHIWHFALPWGIQNIVLWNIYCSIPCWRKKIITFVLLLQSSLWINFKKLVRSGKNSIRQRESDQPGPFSIIRLEVIAIWKWHV
jgi:hypothetical protein